MADAPAQSFENHVQKVPNLYTVGALLALLALVWFAYRTVTDFSVDHLMMLALAVGTAVGITFARLFALRAQDRVVRLETRLRLATVLPADLQPRIKDLTLSQLAALRFASDGELPELTRRVLTDNLTDRTAIKKLIRNWEGDFLRV